jgi:hypothetical protein
MLFITSATQPGGKRRGFMGRYGLGLVLVVDGRHHVADDANTASAYHVCDKVHQGMLSGNF